MVDSLFRSVQDTNESYVAKKRRQQTTNYIQMHWDCGTNATTALCGFVAICCCARCFFYYVFQLFNVLINSFTQCRKKINTKKMLQSHYASSIQCVYRIHSVYSLIVCKNVTCTFTFALCMGFGERFVSDFYFANTFISTELIAFFLLLYY